MQINIKHYDFEITDPIKDYAKHKLSGIKRFYGEDANGVLNVSIGKNNKHHKHGMQYEVKIDTKHKGRSVYVSATSDDVYKSIDEAKDKIDLELSENKDKKVSLIHRMGRRFKDLIKRPTLS